MLKTFSINNVVILGKRDNPAKALIFDSWYDRYKGVAMLVAIHDGSFHLGQSISLASTEKSYEVKEIGVLYPDPNPMKKLYVLAYINYIETYSTYIYFRFAGQVGYIFCNMRTIKEAHMGDTVHSSSEKVEPFEGFRKAKPMVRTKKGII